MASEDLQREVGGNAIFGRRTGAPYQVETIADLKALVVSLAPDGTSVIVLGYYEVGDGGGGTFHYDATSSATADNGYIIAPDAGAGRWLREAVLPVHTNYFGPDKTGATDASTRLNAAFAYCNATFASLHIDEGQYSIGSSLEIRSPYTITCDANAIFRLRSTVASNTPIFDIYMVDAWDVLTDYTFPQMYGPSTDYNDPSTRLGYGILLRGKTSRLDIRFKYAAALQAACVVASGASATIDNINIEANTIDFCEYGFLLSSTTPLTNGITTVSILVNTIWCKYPLYVDGSNALVTNCSFHVSGGAETAEDDGAIIYINGTLVSALDISVNEITAGYVASDSPTGTDPTLTLPFLSGNQSSNGQTTDGNSTTGYSGAHHCKYEFRYSAGLPAGGDCIRIRDVGASNDVVVVHSYNNSIPIALSTNTAESAYNGGVGAASWASAVYCSIDLVGFAAGANADYYVFSQLGSAASFSPIFTQAVDETMIVNGIQSFAVCQTQTANRRFRVNIRNTSGSPFTGTIFFFVYFGND